MLRSGVDIFVLERLMGHADLQVLRRYLAQNDEDNQLAHMRGNPVDNNLWIQALCRVALWFAVLPAKRLPKLDVSPLGAFLMSAGSNPVGTAERNWPKKEPGFRWPQFIGGRVLSIPALGGTMAVQKNPSDQELLFLVELLTIQQLAKRARVSTKSVYRWIESGKIPVVKFGERTYRIPARVVIGQLKESGYEHLVNDHYED
jgi:excisionase family DNA binding protein